MKEIELEEYAAIAESASEQELEQLFKVGMKISQLDAGASKPPSKNEWIQSNLERIRGRICNSNIYAKYAESKELKNRISLIVAIAAMLSLWIPVLAAVAASEALLRIGLLNICPNFQLDEQGD